MVLSLSACHVHPGFSRKRPFSHSRVPPRLAAPVFLRNHGVWRQHGRTRHACIGRWALPNPESSPSSLEIVAGEEREAYEEYSEAFQQAFGIPGTVDFEMGRDGYPCMRLRHPKGGSVEVSLAGAHIPSWTNHTGEEMLYQRDDSQKQRIPQRRGRAKRTLQQGPEAGKAPSGGISLAWPQWGDASHWPPGEQRSGMPFDGFLRVLPWTPVHVDVQREDERHDPVSWVEEEDMEEEDGILLDDDYDGDDDDGDDDERSRRHKIGENEDVRVLAVLRTSSDDLGASDHPGVCAMPYRFEALYSVGLGTPEPDSQVSPDKRQEWELVRDQYGFTPEQRERHSLTGTNKEEPEPIEPPEELQRRQEEEKRAAERGILCYSGERVSEPPEPPPEPTNTDEESEDEEEGPEFGSEHVPSQELWLSLSILNKGDSPLRFSAGLRTRFATEDIAERQRFIKTVGLRGKYSLRRDGDDGGPPRVRQDNDHELTFEPEREVDRLYVDCGDKEFIALCPGWPMHFEMRNEEGFNDIGVLHSADPADARWNAGLSPARVARPVTLQPGEMWTGTARIIAHNDYWDLLPWEQAAGKEITEIVPPLRVKTLLDPEYWWKHMVY